MSLRRVRAAVPTLLLFAALLLAWQVAGPLFGIRAYLLPAPVAVLRAALDFSIPWYAHVWITTLEILGGFVVAGAVGVLLGMAVAWSPAIARALVPFLVFVNAQANLNAPVAFAAVAWISVIGLALYGVVSLAARWFVPWAETSTTTT